MFVSYAQNFEDVLLHRALHDIQNGFYIDLGAHDPIVDSVSMGFYRLGWRGVHVEPLAAYADALRKERPDEIVIEAAVGEAVGVVEFYEIVGTGLSTMDADAAARHVANGFRSEVKTVIGVRLAEILDAHRDRDIHWLKIDVEGQERSVIRSWQHSAVRPWIVVVEAVDPFRFQDSSAAWEPELLALGYTFAYFDGLNRFYVSAAHPELAGSFGIGPNLFDDFSLSGTSSSPFCNVIKSKLAIIEARESDVGTRLADALSEALHQRVELCRRQTDLHELRARAKLERDEASEREVELRNHLALYQGELAEQRKLQVKAEQEKSEASEREAELRNHLALSHGEIAQLQLVAHDQTRVRDALVSEVDALRAYISDFVKSRSWRLTAPIRSVSRATRRGADLSRRILGSLLRRLAAFLRYRAPRLYSSIAGSPMLRATYTQFLQPVPAASSVPPAVESPVFPDTLPITPPSVEFVAATETQFDNSTASAIKRAMSTWRKGTRIHA
jgi:FkbM family methyltransferase